MIITLDSGKELTLEEVKEVIDKFQGLLGTVEKEYIPYPVHHLPPAIGPYYEYPTYT